MSGDGWIQKSCLELQWCPEVPYEDRPRLSPSFIYNAYTHHLMFERKTEGLNCHYKIFLVLGDTHVRYKFGINIYPFIVTVFVGFKESNTEVFTSHTCKHVGNRSNIVEIWSSHQSSIESKLKLDLKNGNYFKFIFKFDSAESRLQFSKTYRKCETEHKSIQTCLPVTDHQLEHLSQDLDDFLDSATLPDVQVRCEGGVVDAHRAVLAARSKVFRTMFKTEMLESRSGVVDASDVDVGTMQLFLKFVYSGKITDVPTETMASRLYTLGDKYEVSSLKDACSDVMVKSLSEENYIAYLTLADAHGDEGFKHAVIDYITDHIELKKNGSWLAFAAEHSKLAVEVYQEYIEKDGQK